MKSLGIEAWAMAQALRS